MCKECDRLRVQLAGCSVAALGWNDKPAEKGDYGWSASYQDVLDLRREYERFKEYWHEWNGPWSSERKRRTTA